jgi:3-phenylpropionate/trans-cinnamate dioxygenase ferredoxin reductase subunit
MRRIVIVGASLAGLRSAEALRREGFDGLLTVIGDEPHLPYDRPPLSKGILTGAVAPSELALRQQLDLDVNWLLGDPVRQLDPASRVVRLARAGAVPYDGLVAATGASPRALPGVPPTLQGVHVLRKLEDAVRLRDVLAARPHVVIVGGGFIGMEVASQCRDMGLEVTLVTPDPVLGRALGALSWSAEQRARDHGVDVRTPCGVRSLKGRDHVEEVVLDDGERIAADVVVVAIGAVPATGWLGELGLDLSAGLLCDSSLAVVGLENVVAAGDVARWRHPAYGGAAIRSEHWSNAGEQAVAAAERLLRGHGVAPHASVPSFWSDQFGVRLQGVGHPDLADEVVVVDGHPAGERFVAEYRRSGRLVAALVSGTPRTLLPYRRELAASAGAL